MALTTTVKHADIFLAELTKLLENHPIVRDLEIGYDDKHPTKRPYHYLSGELPGHPFRFYVDDEGVDFEMESNYLHGIVKDWYIEQCIPFYDDILKDKTHTEIFEDYMSAILADAIFLR